MIRFGHYTLATKNLDKLRSFYKDFVGLKEISFTEGKDCHFASEGLWFVLVQDPNTDAKKDYSHFAFHVDSETFEMFRTSVDQNNIQIWQENTTPGESLYFEDPDGNRLELTTATWQDRFSGSQNSQSESKPES